MALYIILFVAIAIHWLIRWGRTSKDYHEELAPLLAQHGYTFISARRPHKSEVCPFNKYRATFVVVDLLGLFYTDYLMVNYHGLDGKPFEVWVKLECFAFFVYKVEFLPKLWI